MATLSSLSVGEKLEKRLPLLSLGGPMENCEFVEKRPVFARFNHECAKNIWLQLCCLKNHEATCQRNKLRRSGKGPLDIPSIMLPDGPLMARADYSSRSFDSRTEEGWVGPQDCVTVFYPLSRPRFQDILGGTMLFSARGTNVRAPTNLLHNGDSP